MNTMVSTRGSTRNANTQHENKSSASESKPEPMLNLGEKADMVQAASAGLEKSSKDVSDNE